MRPLSQGGHDPKLPRPWQPHSVIVVAVHPQRQWQYKPGLFDGASSVVTVGPSVQGGMVVPRVGPDKANRAPDETRIPRAAAGRLD